MDERRLVVVGRHDPGPWIDDAACIGLPSSLFFAERGAFHEDVRAKAVCAECPVCAQCLDWAIQSNEKYGVWGGLSEKQRRRIRRSRSERDRVHREALIEAQSTNDNGVVSPGRSVPGAASTAPAPADTHGRGDDVA